MSVLKIILWRKRELIWLTRNGNAPRNDGSCTPVLL